jgi:hypothetical protein
VPAGGARAERPLPDGERRARLVRRHLLAPGCGAGDPVAAAAAVVALHATDPASVFLSVHARTRPPATTAAIEEALYGSRRLLRMLAMRRTVFVVPAEQAPVFQAACTTAVAATMRRRYTQFVVEAGLGDGDWLRGVEDAAERALLARGEATGAELSADEPLLRSRVERHTDKAYGGSAAITTWVLGLLAADGRIVRGRPQGSWTSTRYSWSPAAAWLPPGATPAQPLDPAAARAELVRRWLARFGPGTVEDLRWWTGLGARPVSEALRAVGAVRVSLDQAEAGGAGGTGLVLPDDVEVVADAEPTVSLLPALDPSPMGWLGRSFYLGSLGADAGALFDRTGNVGPTLWWGGEVVGGWAHRADGSVAVRFLRDVGDAAAQQAHDAAERLAEWIGPVRVTPRFRTPLERGLAG